MKMTQSEKNKLAVCKSIQDKKVEAIERKQAFGIVIICLIIAVLGVVAMITVFLVTGDILGRAIDQQCEQNERYIIEIK